MTTVNYLELQLSAAVGATAFLLTSNSLYFIMHTDDPCGLVQSEQRNSNKTTLLSLLRESKGVR